MKNSSKKIFSLLLIMIMLISSTGVVNAETLRGNIYGANYYAELDFKTYSTGEVLYGYLSGDAEASGESNPTLELIGGTYDSSDSILYTIYGYSSSSGSCSDTCTASGAYKGSMFAWVDGYDAGTILTYR